MSAPPPEEGPAPLDPLAQAHRQTLMYAADLAQVYRRLRQDEGRLARLEDRLRDVSAVCLDIAASPSAEGAGDRAARAYARWLRARGALVFGAKRGRFRLLGASTSGAARVSLTRAEVGDLGGAPCVVSGPPWSELGLGERVIALSLPGRGGQPVGVVVAQATLPPAGDEQALELLGRFAGLLIEVHLSEELRGEARSTSTAARLDAVEDPCAPLRGSSRAMRRVRELVLKIGPVAAPVLVLGETGTGKELVARALHDASPRRKGPFVAVNCGAFAESLVESEVFGHEAGAFTGAVKRHRGKVELAQGGTLFLDELGEMPRVVQVKLLRFLQDSRYTPVGGEEERAADVRVVAATNRDLGAAVAAGAFREDLLYRLNVFTIALPALRARERDVLELAHELARQLAERQGRPLPALSEDAERRLLVYPWPGNVRELRNVMERAVVLSSDGALDDDLLPGERAQPSEEAADEAPVPSARVAAEVDPGVDVLFGGAELRPFSEAKEAFVARFEARYCEALFAKAGGNIARAARMASVDKKHLRRKLVAYGLIEPKLADESGELPAI